MSLSIPLFGCRDLSPSINIDIVNKYVNKGIKVVITLQYSLIDSGTVSFMIDQLLRMTMFKCNMHLMIILKS